MEKEITLSNKMILELQKLKVAAVYLFGSIAEGVDSEISDLDLGILMMDPKLVSERVSTLDLYQKLYDVLSPLESTYQRKIDIVFLQRASLELRLNAIRCGNLVFDTDPPTRADFEAQTCLLYADFFPLRQQFDQAVLAKI